MSVNMGTATGYLDLDVNGFVRSLNLAQKEAEKKTSGAMSKVSSGFSKVERAFSKAGTTLTNYITKPVLGATGALASLAGWGGFKRLTEIDSAKTKLMALGYTAEVVEKVMENVDAAVTGTAFTMNEGMTIAVSSMAAGKDAGIELEKHMKLIADSASLAEISYSEMGAIMNKVLAKGKTDMDILNQMSERGIPIIAWLGEEFGQT